MKNPDPLNECELAWIEEAMFACEQRRAHGWRIAPLDTTNHDVPRMCCPAGAWCDPNRSPGAPDDSYYEHPTDDQVPIGGINLIAFMAGFDGQMQGGSAVSDDVRDAPMFGAGQRFREWYDWITPVGSTELDEQS